MKETNHTLDDLKQEYEQIPVSPHAKERILAGIAQGKASVKEPVSYTHLTLPTKA